MNTIHEKTNGDLNGGLKSSTSIKSTNVITSTSSTSSNSNDQPNGSANENSSNSGTNSKDDFLNEMKIIGHIKNIEELNEKRRVFVNNTISESSTNEKFETETKTGESVLKNTEGRNDIVHIFKERHVQIREEHVDKSTSAMQQSSAPFTSKVLTTVPLKSPTSPPPKPPLLSRTPSLGASDNRFSYNATTQLPTFAPTSPVHELSLSSDLKTPEVVTPDIAITKATITSATIPEPVRVETVQLTPEVVQITTVELEPDTPILRRVQIMEVPTTAELPRAIPAKHYERLIEELKCPGCACPMKSPILLCKTGHSICEQCTRVLLLCPLCKEPFTNQRSLTVEALCSKAHFRCAHAAGGCTVRLQLDLLGWHEKQCIYKPMKCFMGRVWGDCQWVGREAQWKEHLETEHANKVFMTDTTDLIWNMGIQQKPLTGYYVFEAFDEMFNFFEVYDKERVLFTMTCTSSVKSKKNNFAFEVTIINQDNEALAITQKFPVHSEYDTDILLEGTCVNIPTTDLAKFIDEDRLLHYRVRVLEVKSARKSKVIATNGGGLHPMDFQQTQIEGVNLKNVPSDVILTRKPVEQLQLDTDNSTSSVGPGSSSEDEMDKIRRLYNKKLEANDDDSDPELDAFIAQKWGTPQLHFNRKYLRNASSNSSSNGDAASQNRQADTLGKLDNKFKTDEKDRMSITSNSSSYKKRMTNSLRKSFRSLKSPIIELTSFTKKSEKNSDK